MNIEPAAAPPAVDWDDPTVAEHLADCWHREQSRGRHGIREWPRDERFRQIATERAERVLRRMSMRGLRITEVDQ